jgi:hypothetical protein
MHMQAVSPSFSTCMVTLPSLIKLQGKLAQADLQVFFLNISAQNCKTVIHPKRYDQMASTCFLVFQHPSSFLLLWFDSGIGIGF